MIITYNKTYRESVQGIDWQLFSCVSFKDSLIISELEGAVIQNSDTPFDELYNKLKGVYKNRTVKSRCDISKDETRIEVTVKGVFPRFYIEKNDVP